MDIVLISFMSEGFVPATLMQAAPTRFELPGWETLFRFERVA
jgi:hypothetical protein